MWSTLLDLLRETHRPLVVVDFETAGLNGLPPVSFALLIFQPWDDPVDDELTRQCAAVCPPGLSYATTMLVNPGHSIDPDATRVHGLRDEDVRGQTPYNDIKLRAFFRELALGTPDAPPPETTGPAIFAGHNAASADVPWAMRWGLLPDRDGLDVIDTMRIVRRLQAEYPHPIAVDANVLDGLDRVTGMPCIELGLDAFASSLTGAHAAVCGTRIEGAHDALADVCATARVLARVLDAWGPIWPKGQKDQTAEVRLVQLLAALDAPPPSMLSWDGWLRKNPDGAPLTGPLTWAKGKHQGMPVTVDPGYLEWVRQRPRGPTGINGDAWCSDLTASILASKLKP